MEEFDLPREYGVTISDDEMYEITTTGMNRVLGVLEQHGVCVTFFVTANYALREGEMIKRMVAGGHEIASHGYDHGSFCDIDLQKSRDVLCEVSGQDVVGFRRARLVETNREAIAAAGYTYNSSENPIWLPGRYNHFFGTRTAYLTGELLNVPISATPWLRVPLFWLGVKHFPMWLIKSASARVLRHDGYLNIFFHPWEFVDLSKYDLPRVITRRMDHVMLGRLSAYLRWLSGRGDFICMRDFDLFYRDKTVEEKEEVGDGVG